MPYAVRLARFASAAALASACLSQQTATYNMTWEYRQTDATMHGARHIVFRFIDYPRYYYGIHSRDLGAYLESLPSARVAVTFRLYSGPRGACGMTLERVGEKTKWDSQFEYQGLQGWIDSTNASSDSSPCSRALRPS